MRSHTTAAPERAGDQIQCGAKPAHLLIGVELVHSVIVPLRVKFEGGPAPKTTQ